MAISPVASLRREYWRDAMPKPGGDPVRRAYSQAFAERLDTDHDFRAWSVGLITDMRKGSGSPVPDSQFTAQVLYHLQWPLIENDNDYPGTKHEDPKTWAGIIGAVYDDAKSRDSFAVNNILFRPVTNSRRRYAAACFAAQLLDPDILAGPINVLDIGTSRGHGLAWLDARTIPEAAERLVDPNPALNRPIRTGLADGYRTFLMQCQSTQWGRLVGVDLSPIVDPLLARWFRANRTPSELRDGRFLAEADFLEGHFFNSPKTHFVTADWAQPQRDDIPAEARSEGLQVSSKFHIIINNTVVYQQSQQGWRTMEDNNELWLADGGLEVVSDHLFRRRHEGHLEHRVDAFGIYGNWRLPWRYRSMLRRKGSEQFTPFAYFDNSRCSIMEPKGELRSRLMRLGGVSVQRRNRVA